MNGFLNPPSLQQWRAGYRPMYKHSDADGKPMSEIYVVLDQREDRINNGFFAVDMNGYNARNPNATHWLDYPAHYHNNAGGVTLADGHAVIKKCDDPRTSEQSARASVSRCSCRRPKTPISSGYSTAPLRPSQVKPLLTTLGQAQNRLVSTGQLWLNSRRHCS